MEWVNNSSQSKESMNPDECKESMHCRKEEMPLKNAVSRRFLSAVLRSPSQQPPPDKFSDNQAAMAADWQPSKARYCGGSLAEMRRMRTLSRPLACRCRGGARREGCKCGSATRGWVRHVPHCLGEVRRVADCLGGIRD